MVFQPNDKTNLRHGASYTPLYRTWRNIKSRCYNPNTDYYYLYGQRGIEMCDEWKNDFIEFQDWSLANGYTEELTIDRIDGTKGYSPDNCRWVTQAVNNRNRSVNINLTVDGETKVLADWVADPRCSIKRQTLRRRLELGWSPERAVKQPLTA